MKAICADGGSEHDQGTTSARRQRLEEADDGTIGRRSDAPAEAGPPVTEHPAARPNGRRFHSARSARGDRRRSAPVADPTHERAVRRRRRPTGPSGVRGSTRPSPSPAAPRTGGPAPTGPDPSAWARLRWRRLGGSRVGPAVTPTTPAAETAGPPGRPRAGCGLSSSVAAALVGALIGGGIVAATNHDGGSTTTVKEISAGPALLNGTTNIESVIAKVLPAVVSIDATSPAPASQSLFGGGDGGEQEDQGTGMIITPNGEVVTNNHVIAGATTITVTLYGSLKAMPGHPHRHRPDQRRRPAADQRPVQPADGDLRQLRQRAGG